MRIVRRIMLFTICLTIVSGFFISADIVYADPLNKSVSITVKLYGAHGTGDFPAVQAYNDGTYTGTLIRQDNTLRSIVRAYPTVSYSYQSDIQYPNDKPAGGQFTFPSACSSSHYDPLSGQSFPATLWTSGSPYFTGSVTTTTMYWTHYGYQYDPINHTKLGYMSNNTTTYYSGQYRFSNPPRQPTSYYGPSAEEGLGWIQYQAPDWDGALQDSTKEPWRSICIAYHGVARFVSDTTGVENRYRKPVRIYYRRTASSQYIYQNYAGTATVTDTEITYAGTVSLIYTPDLTVASLTTDRPSYNAGETITVTAVIQNIGNGSAGASTARLTLGPYTVDRNVSALAGGATQTITFTMAAPMYASATTLTASVTVDFTAAVAESNETNNSASRNITINAGLPDLTITNLATDKAAYEAGETVTVTAIVKNQGYSSANNFIVRLSTNPAISAQDKSISLTASASTTLTYAFIAPTYLDATNMMIQVTADSANTVAESNEGNNSAAKAIGINAQRPDLIIESANTTDWHAGMDVLVSSRVTNLSAQPVPAATIRLTAGSVTVNETVPVPGNGSNLAVFRFTVPTPPNPHGTMQLAVIITVDPDKAIDELNENNNAWTKTETVSLVPASLVIDPDSQELEQAHISRSKSVPSLPQVSPSIYHTWQEVRLENGSYVVRNFWARLGTLFELSPDSRVAYPDSPDLMESGFGVQAYCKTTLMTNYDHPEKLIGPQMVWAYSPESLYGQGQWQNVRDVLEAGSGDKGDKVIEWRYAVNSYSETGSRLHYTSLWFPDGQYTVLAQAFYAWSPVGQMVDYAPDGVIINGDMYDRVAVVRGR